MRTGPRRSLERQLDDGVRAKARITVVATDAASNRDSERVEVTVQAAS
jgi:hypothetical protein